MKKLLSFLIIAPMLAFGGALPIQQNAYTTGTPAQADSHVAGMLASGTNSFAGNASGIYGFLYYNAGYKVIYATNYGVVGIPLSAGASLAGLVSQDTALLAFRAALSNNVPSSGICPSGFIMMTTNLDFNFSGFMLVGQGILHNEGFGNAQRFGLPYTVFWQSNTNSDCFHFNKVGDGLIRIQDWEAGGGLTPNHNMGDAAYFGAPMGSIYVNGSTVTNNNKLSKVGITIREISGFGGGIRADNISVDGFKIGIVNGGNDEQWNFIQMPECDVGWWNDSSSASRGYWFGAGYNNQPINPGYYASLIDSSTTLGQSLGAPDQVELNNVSFGERIGGLGLWLGYGNSFQIHTSCGINAPKCYAEVSEGCLLDVDGGNDEPNQYMGTNWIYGLRNCFGVTAKNWRISWAQVSNGTNFYGDNVTNTCFYYTSDSDSYAFNLTRVAFLNNMGISDVNWYNSLVGASIYHPHNDQSGYIPSGMNGQGSVIDFSTGDFLGAGVFQPSVGHATSFTSGGVQGQLKESLGRPLLIKSTPWDVFIAEVANGTPQYTNTDVIRFITTDPITASNYYIGKPALPPLNVTLNRTMSTNLYVNIITNLPGSTDIYIEANSGAGGTIHIGAGGIGQGGTGGITRIDNYCVIDGNGALDLASKSIINFEGGSDGATEMRFLGTTQNKIGLATSGSTDTGGMTNNVWWGNGAGFRNISTSNLLSSVGALAQSGQVGEVISNSAQANVVANSTNFVTSITLTSGTWLITSACTLDGTSTSPGVSAFKAGVAGSSGVFTGAYPIYAEFIDTSPVIEPSYGRTLTMPVKFTTISTSTTFYLNAGILGSGFVGQYFGYESACRLN